MSESKVPRQEEIVLATVQGKEVTSLPEDLYVPPNSLKIFLDSFAGPLDLLLYLIRKQNLNKNWSDLGSVLIDSLPEILQKDQKEWLGYQWNLVVGKEISEISFVDKIVQGTIHIRVQDSEWLPALESLKQKFIFELNSKAGKQLVSKIKLII